MSFCAGKDRQRALFLFSLLLLGLALAPHAEANPFNPFNSFTDSGPVSTEDWAAIRRERHALEQALAPNYEMTVPFVGEASIQALTQAIARYQRIAARGGWPAIDTSRTLRPGDTGLDVRKLRARLALEGDLSRDSGSASFDEELVQGLARYQIRNGLRVSGFVDRRTARSLMVPARERLQQLQTNLARIQELMKINDAERYVLVNVPGYQLQAVQDGHLALSSEVIVGRPQRATPQLSAKIVEVNFYPVWRVPDSVARKDLIPAIRKDPEYFYKEHFNVMPAWHADPMDPRQIDWSSPEVFNYKFRQDPGSFNALGVVRINMPNKHAVYLHDTPMKALFDQSLRAFSSGCVRVRRVLDLVSWLVGAEKGWNAARVSLAAEAGESIDVKLRRPVPVHFTYITAWALPNGVAQFRPDIYGQDAIFADDADEGQGAIVAEQRSAIAP